MIDLDKWFDFDNMPPKKRAIAIRVIIVILCILTTLAGVLFSELTM